MPKAPSAPDAQATAPAAEGPRGRGIVSRRRGPDVARVVAYMPTEMSDQLLVAAARGRRSVSECVNEAVREWLKGNA